MTEDIKNHEAHNGHEKTSDQHEQAHRPEVDHSNLEKQQKDLLEASRVTAEEHSAPSNLLAIENDEPKHNTHIGTHHALKKESYANLLKQARTHLPAASRQFSKVIHQKNIETISNVGAQTVARPSGLLGGGIGALIGSITLLYTSKHYGFKYNYAFFLVTFLVGFLVGLALEAMIKLLRKRS